MSDFQTGINHVLGAARDELKARKIDGSVSSTVRGSTQDGARITIVARGKTVETWFTRKQIDDCLQGATVAVQVELKRVIDQI